MTDKIKIDIVNEVSKLLDDKKAREKIQEEEKNILSKGITIIPTIIFNGGKTMNGAYPVEEYKQVLNELIK